MHSPVTNLNSVNSVNSVDNQLTVGSFTTQEQPQANQLKVLCTNADQFINKRDDLQLFIAGDKPDIIIITEILPKAPSIMSDSLLPLPGYTLYFNFDCGSVYNSLLINVVLVSIQLTHYQLTQKTI